MKSVTTKKSPGAAQATGRVRFVRVALGAASDGRRKLVATLYVVCHQHLTTFQIFLLTLNNKLSILLNVPSNTLPHMTHIPDTDTSALTEVIRFRATREVKKAVGHIAVDAGASEQNTYIHLLELGLEAFERDGQDARRKKAGR